MAKTEVVMEKGELKIIIDRARAEEIKNTPIDTSLEQRLAPGSSMIPEKVDYGPGAGVNDRLTVLYKLGSGARGHVYAAIWTPVHGTDMGPVVKACLPYASRKHYLELLLRDEKDKSFDLNKYGDYIRNVIREPIKVLKEEIKYTNPVHNYRELRALSGSPAYEKVVLKFLTNDMIKSDPESKEELIKEGLMLSKVNHPSIPKFIDFVETEKGMGYISGFVDGRTLGELIEDDWWRKKDGKNVLEFYPEKVVIAKFAKFYDNLMHNHNRGVLFSDIQQGNYMLSLDGELYSIDYGSTDEIVPGKTTIDSVGANEDFMPPEWITHLKEERKEGKVYCYRIKKGEDISLELRSNVWSGGVLAWWMISGGQDYPFKGHPFPRLVESIRKQKHSDPRTYHGSRSGYRNEMVKWLVDMPLRKNPEERPYPAEIHKHLLTMLGDESPDEVLRNFMAPLREIREKSFRDPSTVSIETPKRNFLKKSSMPIRKAKD